METRASAMSTTTSSRGKVTYRITVEHSGLRSHRVITGNDASIVQRKAYLQAWEWNERWRADQARDAARQEASRKKEHVQAQKDWAAQRTEEAGRELEGVESLLAHTLGVDDRIDWDLLLDRSGFAEPAPVREPPVPAPAEPSRAQFEPVLGFLDKWFASRRARKLEAAEQSYAGAHAAWQSEVARLSHDAQQREARFVRAAQVWEQRRDAFAHAQAESNAALQRSRAAYGAREPDAVRDYCDMVLSNSEYPGWVPKQWELAVDAESATLLVDYVLPAPDGMPRVAEIKYVQARDAFEEKPLTEAKLNKLYDSMVYQVALRTLHELFEADAVGALRTVVFNGVVRSVDPATGRTQTSYIVSVKANKEAFGAFNLAQVDPKACFKGLKGVGDSKLHSLTAVTPIARIDPDDGRIVEAREMARS